MATLYENININLDEYKRIQLRDLWKSVEAIGRFSSEWHALLPKLPISFFLESPRDIIPEEDGNLLISIGHVLQRYSPQGWIGFIDALVDCSLKGWCKRIGSDDSQFISLAIQRKLAYECFLSNAPRADVQHAGYGSGLYGFDVAIDHKQILSQYMLVELIDPYSDKTIAFKYFPL